MRLPYVWDYDLDQAQFLAILEGKETSRAFDFLTAWLPIHYPELVK